MSNFLTNNQPWYVFLVHPRNDEDLLKFEPGKIMRNYSKNFDDFKERICKISPIVAGEVFVNGTSIKGEIIAVMRTPEKIISREGRNEIYNAVRLAQNRGAKYIGLGGLIAPATIGGKLIAENLQTNSTITNGNSFTASVVVKNVLEVVQTASFGKNALIAVVGCTGSVGYTVCNLLADKGFKLYLVGRSEANVRKRFPVLPPKSKITDLSEAMLKADIVVLLTNKPTGVLNPKESKRGSFIIDCAQPANFSKELRKKLLSEDVKVFDGGLVQIPDFVCSYDFGFGTSNNITYACLAETYLFARNGIRNHAVGISDPAFALKMEYLAEKAGIKIKSVLN
jgi:fatty aldehyde-generating acyl-ACP reductase